MPHPLICNRLFPCQSRCPHPSILPLSNSMPTPYGHLLWQVTRFAILVLPPKRYTFWYNLRHTEMIRIRQMARHFCRRIAATLLAFAAAVLPFVARAEKANVFFIHGANVSEQDAREAVERVET